MLFTSDSHLMQTCRFYRLFTQWLRREKRNFCDSYSNYRLESGQKVSLEDGSSPRDRLSLGRQNGPALWWFVPDRSHGASSSNPLSRSKRLALSVTNHKSRRNSTIGKLNIENGPVSYRRHDKKHQPGPSIRNDDHKTD